MKKKTLFYLVIAFGWTWIYWIGSYFIGVSTDYSLNIDIGLFKAIKQMFEGTGHISQIVFGIGVYGPLLGYLYIHLSKKKMTVIPGEKESEIIKSNWKKRSAAIYIPCIMIIPTLCLNLLTESVAVEQKTVFTIVITIVIYFVSNLFTSGTEEFGWRGYLYGALRAKGYSFWDTAWKGGFIWAAWHYPMMILLYMSQGWMVTISSLLGFTAGIVAVNYITNFIYEKNRSILLVMIMHALNNTLSFIMMFLFANTKYVIAVHLMAWAVVIFLEKKYKTQ